MALHHLPFFGLSSPKFQTSMSGNGIAQLVGLELWKGSEDCQVLFFIGGNILFLFA
jgi:hypothetical protein